MVARAPRRRMYRTMQGRMVDIEKLRAANESVRAVGNMNVNARGDVLGPGGQITTSKAEVMQKYYEQPKGKVDDTPARAKPTPPRKTPPTPVQKMTPVESKPTAKPVETFKPKTPTEKKGIDAALDGLES
jgi:cell division protein FtsN|tara:strand:+ start:546 stop:935 length:390 start_codon:yes stop_codon:yes gene_type:complete